MTRPPHGKSGRSGQSAPAQAAQGADIAQLRFRTLLYRFIFFDWLFADVGRARTPLERHAAAQHNRRMRQYLPVYLRRWSCLTLLAFALGCLVENALQATLLSAWFFTGSCITATGAVVITVAWIFLAQPQRPQ